MGRHAGAPLPDVDPPSSALMCLLLTSGSTAAPEGGDVQPGRWGHCLRGVRLRPGGHVVLPMPLSHGNALNAGLFPALASGARLLLRDRFSATSWLDDVRAHGVSFTNTVGRALGYVLATPPGPHDRDHRLKVVLAPEASPRDMAEFHDRFGVTVLSGYGSSEGGMSSFPRASPDRSAPHRQGPTSPNRRVGHGM
jgi:fatty-acyl-CoA synthase